MATKDEKKPRLKNLDDLFGMNEIETPPASKSAVISVEIKKLTPFNGHPFRLYEGERLDDMVESVKTNGILVPILVRKVDNTLETLAGHNRVNAAQLAGLSEVPVIILEDVSDEDALVYVVETNLLQRSFSDMAHSEKAAVIALHHSKMFSQGKRNDILFAIQMLEKPNDGKENKTSGQVGQKLETREKVAQEYNLSSKTVARYLRINKLIPALKMRLDSDDLAFIPAVTLSFLREDEQEIVDDCLSEYGFAVTLKRADELRELSGKLNNDLAYEVLSGETSLKRIDAPSIKLSKKLYTKYFKPDQSAKEVQGIVEKALELYFKQDNA